MSPFTTIRQLYLEGHRREALAMARWAAKTEPSPMMLHTLGYLELSANNYAAAGLAFEQAVHGGTTSDCSIYADWGTCLARQGLFEEAAARFDEVLPSSPQYASAQSNRGSALLRLRRPKQALCAFREALSREPRPLAELGIVRALAALGEHTSAETRIRRLARTAQLPFETLDAMLELRLGTAEERHELARRFSAERPRHSGIRALALRAWAEVNPEAADDAQAPYRELSLTVPDTEARRRLFSSWSASVRAHPSLNVAPAEHATVGGRHSGHLFADPDFDLSDLESEISTLVRRWIETLSVVGPETMYSKLPAQVQIHAWAVDLDVGDYQELHFHPDAWASGCLYLDVPPEVEAGGEEGAFYFRSPSGLRSCLTPRVGAALVFPSCLDHGTIPMEVGGGRLSVAFDVIAVEARA